MSGPTHHLTWEELSCRDRTRTPYPLDWRPSRSAELGRAFEAVRAACSDELVSDCPLTVLEGYRTEAYQAYLRSIPSYKAALHSQHCEGYAIDIACPRGLTFRQFEAAVKRATAAPGSKIRYVEFRPSMHYIHIDCRQTAKLVIEEVT